MLVREGWVAEIEEKPETEEKYKRILQADGSCCCRNRRLSMIYGQMMRFKNRV